MSDSVSKRSQRTGHGVLQAVSSPRAQLETIRRADTTESEKCGATRVVADECPSRSRESGANVCHTHSHADPRGANARRGQIWPMKKKRELNDRIFRAKGVADVVAKRSQRAGSVARRITPSSPEQLGSTLWMHMAEHEKSDDGRF